MTDTPPTRQALEAVNRSAPGKVTGRLKAAIDAMVWQAARRGDAAKTAGMTDHSLRAALRKPHVMAYLQAELRTLRESERPKTHGRLVELRDQNSNMNAAVSAAKALEQISDEQAVRGVGATIVPGVTIKIVHMTPPSADAGKPLVDITPPRSAPLPAPQPIENDDPPTKPATPRW